VEPGHGLRVRQRPENEAERLRDHFWRENIATVVAQLQSDALDFEVLVRVGGRVPENLKNLAGKTVKKGFNVFSVSFPLIIFQFLCSLKVYHLKPWAGFDLTTCINSASM
jgi:hypothetical protein